MQIDLAVIVSFLASRAVFVGALAAFFAAVWLIGWIGYDD